MDRKPLKRSNHLLPVSREHHFSLLFCWKIRRGIEWQVDTGRISSYVQTFWNQNLYPHFTEEETLLFADTADPLVQKALEEHTSISQLADQIIRAARNTTPQQLAVFADTLDKHIRFEERIVFPYLEKTFTAAQLKHIASCLQQTGGVTLKDNYADEFWKNPDASL